MSSDNTPRLFQIAETFSSDDWYTPPWLFDGLGLRFDLDVAAPANGCPWVPADNHYNESDNGLAQPWHGLVWCNPPYSNPAPWCQRWARHRNGLILLRADLSSSGPLAALGAATSLWSPPKRLQFVSRTGAKTRGVNFATVLFGAGPAADAGISRLACTRGGVARMLSAMGVDSLPTPNTETLLSTGEMSK